MTNVLFTANKDAVLDRRLYAVPAGGSGTIELLSRQDGVHEIEAPMPAVGYFDLHSAADRLPQAIIYGLDGSERGRIEVPLGEDHDALQLRPAELVTIDGDGGPTLHGALLKPRKLEPGKRYPAIIMVYGGPGVQAVANHYNPRLIWQHLADRGVVVLQVDNRGAAGYGHEHEAALYRRMGTVELTDQLRALDYLTKQPFVDAGRVGIYGHSYGGYMAALAMLKAPGRFKVGVAGSPVTDWRLYDTGYTERYMGTPAGNPDGYAASEVVPLAGRLQGKLFILHALMDENVHFEHTARLIDALIAADKDFDLLIFPGERHGYRSPAARRYAYRRVVEYFAREL